MNCEKRAHAQRDDDKNCKKKTFFSNLNKSLTIEGSYSKEKLGQQCESVTNIFEYLNILVTNIFSDIRSYHLLFNEFIRTFVRVKFVCTNIFGHSLVSVLERKTKTNMRIYSTICANFNTNTYSDIRSCQKK